MTGTGGLFGLVSATGGWPLSHWFINYDIGRIPTTGPIYGKLKDSTFGNISGHVLSTVNNNTTIHHNYPAVSNKKFFGRDHEIKEIVQILTPLSQSKRSPLAQIFTKPAFSHRGAHIALLGAGGQGKTETALQVMAHPAIKEYYDKKNSIWVPCDEANSSELFLDVLFNSLALNQDNKNTLEAILKELCKNSKPVILLLDNFETPWNAPEARGDVEHILQEIARFSHVTLFVTMRATIVPCEDIKLKEIKIQALGPEASHQLFGSIYPQLQHDPELPDLLEMVGHMALAVKLMARYGKNTGCLAKQLLSSYRSTGTSMLGSVQGDPQSSVSVSICISLESSLVKNELNAGQLLSIIARLPSGTTFNTLEQWSYLLDPLQPPDDIHDSMVNAACKFLKPYTSTTPGKESFQNDMQERSIEEINLKAILLQTSELSTDVIKALCTLAWHQYRVRPRTEHQLVAHTSRCYAAILYSLNCFKESFQQSNLAREAYLAASEPTLAARALIDIAMVSSIIDNSFNEIPLLEQAQHELESLGEDDEQWRMAMSHCLMLLGMAYTRCDGYSEALEHLTRARDLCSDLPSQGASCVYYLAGVHYRLQQFDEAEKTAVQSVNEQKQIGADPGWPLWLLGKIYISKTGYSKAIKSLEEGLQIAKTYGNQQNTAHIFLELGHAYMKISKNNDAKKSFSQALVNYGNLEGVEEEKIVCQYYINKLDDSGGLPTLEQEDALGETWHEEDLPGWHISMISKADFEGHL
ncbi:hypothetical protein C8J56DRAFT_1087394 [Mycena floridula]|nr:hypothetical protein C8J56DRAFT_1087394 [Mycena floridula]